jgi:glycine/D-amino acid oxidase-like deaminating enzyme
MTSPHVSQPPVAVVGGGILGVSTAWHLARRGARVTLLSAGRLADGASGRSLAWLNSWGDRSPAYHDLRMRALDRYRAFARHVPEAAAYLRLDGGLTWASPGDDSHLAAFARMRANGYEAEWLEHDAVASRTPGVDVASIPAEGAMFNRGEGWVDLSRLVARLARELRGHGGSVVEGTGPVTPVVRGGRVAGVEWPRGRLASDRVVLATGAGVPAALARLGVTVPDATSPALLVRTPPVATRLRAVLNTPRVSLRPTPEGGLVMDSAWSEGRVRMRPDGGADVDPDVVERLLREATAVLDGNPPLAAESLAMGPKPVPGDGEPVLGRVEGVGGLHVAFTHSGATLGLLAGELLATEVLTGRTHPLLRPFAPARFG